MELGINVCLHRKFFQTASPKRKFPFQSILAVLWRAVFSLQAVWSSEAGPWYGRVCCWKSRKPSSIWVWKVEAPKGRLKGNKIENACGRPSLLEVLTASPDADWELNLPHVLASTLLVTSRHVTGSCARRGHFWNTDNGRGQGRTC